jgi:hypothetical protein
MSMGGLAADAAHLHHPRLDHDPARPEAHAALGQAPAMLARERRRELRASAARVEAASSRRGATGASHPARIAAGTGDGVLGLPEEGSRPAYTTIATAARAAQARLEAGIIVAGHGEDIRAPGGRRKASPTGTHKEPVSSKA